MPRSAKFISSMGFWKNIWKRKGKYQGRSDVGQTGDDQLVEEEIVPDAVVVTDVLDLHGFYPEQVPEMIHDFLINAEELGLRSLRIIHGKGKSKLKWVVLRELEKYPQVGSFRDAPPELGGWGATLVYLKSQK